MLDADFEKGSRVPMTGDTSSPETYQQIRTWLNTCKNEHPKCQVSSANPSLPTRLIYLDISRDSSLSHPGDTSLQPRLISTDGKEYSECRYITLSYRWPEDFPIEAKSTRENIREQMRGLNTSRLPQMFNDVFQVAVRTGISYVWIDSLCIVQDDPEDWSREAALMAHVYQYAEFTVAAAIPPTKPDLGLFRRGDPSDVLSARLPGLRTRQEDKYSGHEVVVMRPQKEETHKDDPLDSRGWCFQERELSQRVAHYTETQAIWECRTLRASESRPNNDSSSISRDYWKPRNLDDRNIKADNVNYFWHEAVEDYSARHLTVCTDKLPALAGLAAFTRDYMPANCRYLAGLWEDDEFERNLIWSSGTGRYGKTVTNTRYPEYVAPTWSWASVAGPVFFSQTRYDPWSAVDADEANAAKRALKVLDVYVQTSTDNPFGAVSHAVLTCTAGLVPGVLEASESDPSESNPSESDPCGPKYLAFTAEGGWIGEVNLDAPENYDGEEVNAIFCIYFGFERSRNPYGPGMVIVPTGNREDEYRRVGMVEQMRGQYSVAAEIKEITII